MKVTLHYKCGDCECTVEGEDYDYIITPRCNKEE